MKLLIATQNKGKRKELQHLLGDTMVGDAPITLLMPSDVGLEGLNVEETGSTLGENAILKVKAFSQSSGLYAIADDTGLYVDALDGRPGIYPARYGGPGLDAAGRRQKLLDELAGVPLEARTARFECVVALTNPDTGMTVTVQGVCHGRIAEAERGGAGFGYDSVFIPNGYTQTFAEIADTDEKHKDEISHRGDAVRKILPTLKAWALS
jgi:XTP/dITP diphosphohydrolase